MRALKIIRVLVAGCTFALVTLFFVGLGGGCGLLEKVQLIPALLAAGSLTAMAALTLWVVVTLLFGRVYCSVMCPLGILQDILLRLARLCRVGGTFRARPDRPWFRSSSLFVFAVLVLMGGASLAGLIDPYSVFGRIATHLLQPVVELANDALADWLGTDGSVVLFKARPFVRGLEGLVLAGVSLVALAALVAWRGRIFCNTLCPAGAMLAALSRRSLFRIEVDAAKCVKCGRCARACKATCIDVAAGKVDNARCVRCFDCFGTCAKGALSYRPVSPTRNRKEMEPSSDLRAFAADALCLLTMPFIASWHRGAVKRAVTGLCPGVLPPPGARAASLRTSCTACGLCVAKCPSRVLVPSGVGAYGPLTFLLPRMDFRHGFCPPDCTVCGDVCPTGAILPLKKDKDGRKIARVGLAKFDRTKCLTAKDGLECGLCSRRCPSKAITLEGEGKVKVPVVDAAKCTGCGACEHYCPSSGFRVVGRFEAVDSKLVKKETR